MSMINCPECNKEISDKAESCPYCGCPQSEFKFVFVKPDQDSINICPHCGYINSVFYECIYCLTKMSNTGVTRNDLNDGVYGDKEKWEEEQLKKVRTNPEFSEEAYQDRITNDNDKYLDVAKQIPISPYVPENAPKCPTCNSTNIEKIGTGERVVSAALFGLFSRKVTKTYRCNSCGYMW